MANEPNATAPAGDPPADTETTMPTTGTVLMRTVRGYNLIDANLDLDMKDGEVYEVPVDKAKKIVTKHPDYVQVAPVPTEDKE